MMSAEIEKQGRRRRRAEAENEEVEEAEETEETVEEQSEGRGYTAKKGYATPSRRKAKAGEEEETGNVVTRSAGGLVEYFQGVRDELQKVTWPTREETLRLGRIVLLVVIASSLILGTISLFFNWLFGQGIQNPVYFAVFFVVVAVAAWFVRTRVLTQTDEPTSFSR